MVNDIITTSGPKFSLGIIFPFLRKIFPKIDPFIENITKTDIIRDFVTKTIEEHEESFNPDEQPRDFIDVYFQEQSGCDPDSSFSGEIGRVNLINTLIDLFFAGSETTSSTLTWGILYLILNPDVQDRLRQEICQVVGTERQPKLGDRLNMPYTEAVIQEIQRLGNIAPFGLPHSTYKTSVIIGKYVIPKGHSIHAQLGGVMKSKASWGQDAQVFKPERFIKDEDSSVIRDERLIPFLVGKRQCPGETLAKAEIFLYLTGILQKLKFSVEDPENPPSPDNYVSGTTAAPNPFTAKIDII
jgi:cytochrome P450